VPPEKLLVIKLEDGLGWTQICPFLGHKVPEMPYPRGNDPKEFGRLVNEYMMTRWVNWFVKLGLVALGMAVLAWWSWIYKSN